MRLPITCIDCDKIFQDFDELHQHYDVTHAIQQCVHCPEVLDKFGMYEAHLKNQHDIEIPMNYPGGRCKILEDISKTAKNERMSSFPPRAVNAPNRNSILKTSFATVMSVSPSSNDLQMDFDPLMDVKENKHIDPGSSGTTNRIQNRNQLSVQTDNENLNLDSNPDEAQPMEMDSNNDVCKDDEKVLYVPEIKEENCYPVKTEMSVPTYNENLSDLCKSDEEELHIPEIKLEEPNYPVVENEMPVQTCNKNRNDLYKSDKEIEEKHWAKKNGGKPVLLPVSDEIEWIDSPKIEETETSFPCQVCGQVFSNEKMRNRHRLLHNVPGDKPFECKFCSKAFATHSNRKEHERIHTGERPYKCPVCERGFIQISNLKKHILTHKDLSKLEQCITRDKKVANESRSHATNRKFKCNLCDCAYNYASLLKRHMRKHTGEQPYQCPDCNMPFRELVSLNYHRKKIHTGERPHKCIICGRGFINSSDMKKHHRVHFKVPEKKKSVKKLKYKVSFPSALVAKPPVVNVTERATGLKVADGKHPTAARSPTSNVVIVTKPTVVKKITEIREMRLPITCIDCDRIFQDFDQLRQHYDITHAIQECVHCPEIFDNFEKYEAHLKDQHDIEMPMNYPGGRCKILDDISKAIRDERELSIANLKFFYNYASSKRAPTEYQPSTSRSTPRLSTRIANIAIQKQIQVEKNGKHKEQEELEKERGRQERLRRAIKAKLAKEEKIKMEKSHHKIMVEAIIRKHSFRLGKKPRRDVTPF